MNCRFGQTVLRIALGGVLGTTLRENAIVAMNALWFLMAVRRTFLKICQRTIAMIGVPMQERGTRHAMVQRMKLNY